MKAFIFDLDGTLNDSIPLILCTTAKAWMDLGLPVDEAKIKSYIGIPLVETGEALLGPGRGQEYLQAYLRHYDPDCIPMRAFPGIPALLGQLKAKGARLAIATAKRHEMTLDTLRIIGLENVMDALVVSESTERRKPFADPALKALELLGQEQKDAIFIGDSVHDISCGHNAGLPACAVTWGAAGRADLVACRPEYIVDSVGELAQLLLALCG